MGSVWGTGQPPMSTADNDVGDKREVYERLGIGEYWRFDGCR